MNRLVLLIALGLFGFSTKSLTALEKLMTIAKKENQLEIILSKYKNEQNKEIFKDVPLGVNPLNPDKLKRISSSFGNRYHPISGKYKKHLGLDISATENLAIHVTANGKVTRVVYSNEGYGNWVEVRHKYGFKTRYAHLNVITVRKGQNVNLGDIIGGVGTTGSSTGNHLHYEIIKNNHHINPEKFI